LLYNASSLHTKKEKKKKETQLKQKKKYIKKKEKEGTEAWSLFLLLHQFPPFFLNQSFITFSFRTTTLHYFSPLKSIITTISLFNTITISNNIIIISTNLHKLHLHTTTTSHHKPSSTITINNNIQTTISKSPSSPFNNHYHLHLQP
jgi:hypothetical protein